MHANIEMPISIQCAYSQYVYFDGVKKEQMHAQRHILSHRCAVRSTRFRLAVAHMACHTSSLARVEFACTLPLVASCLALASNHVNQSVNASRSRRTVNRSANLSLGGASRTSLSDGRR